MTDRAGRPGVRLFQGDLLERVSRASPATVMAFWIPFALLNLAAALRLDPRPWPLIGGTMYGVISWSLFEYGLHRFGFHARPASPWLRRLVFVVHGCHHIDPGDPTRNVMPLAASVPAGVVLYGGAFCLFPAAAAAWIAGVFALSYVAYDVGHWCLHQRRFNSVLGRFLRARHMRHHFSGVSGNYGVTSPLWDAVFRTVIGRDAAS